MEKKKLKILFTASECAPIAKVGGLGDVIGSLPKALKNLGVDVKICLPRYQIIDFGKSKFKKIAKDIIVKEEKVNVYEGFLPESQVPIYLLENKKFFNENGIYFERTAFVGSFKEIERFLFFSQAILEVFNDFQWQPQIIHCHDWHTAIVAVLLKIKSQKPKTKILLTIHNLANQGKWNAEEILSFLGLKGEEIKSLKIKDEYGNLNILEQGILNADLINTVSPTYAREILTKEYGEGLEKDLIKRKKDLFGILNGIDDKRFDPQTDPDLKSNYSWQNLDKKVENKLELQKILSFAKDSKVPLFGFIGRLTSQKGIDLIIKIVPELIKRNCQLVILGVGDLNYEKKLLELSQQYPQNISFQIKFDPVLAQKIYAGCDFLLIPSKFEPCGLVQMIAMRYGTLPIGRKIGGLSDTIEDERDGFLFEKYEADSFFSAIKKAIMFFEDKEKLNLIQKSAMKKDFSWLESAQKYLKIYEKLLKLT
jgi:starch synthase